MASLLESAIKKQVAAAFKGKLLTGTLRRSTAATVDGFGDVSSPTTTDYAFEGIRDTFDAKYAAGAGIPETDVRILIIAGSLAAAAGVPRQGDQILIRGAWHHVRRVISIDPANATYVLQAFEIDTP